MSYSRDLRIRMILDASDKAAAPVRAVRDEMRKAKDEVDGTSAALGRLERAQAQLSQFRDLKRGLQSTGEQLEAARVRARRLAAGLAAAEKPTKRMREEFARAKREAAALGRAFEERRLRLHDHRSAMRDAGLSTRDLAGQERRLAGEVASTNARLAEQRRRLQELKQAAPRRLQEIRAAQAVDEQDAERSGISASDGLSALGMTLRTAAVGAVVYGGARIAKESADADRDFESRLTDIALKANMTREEARALGDELRRMGPELNKLPMEMVDGVDILAAQGLERRFYLAAIRPIARTSAAYKAEIADLSDAAFAAKTNLEVPVEQLNRTLEIMAAGDEKGAFGVADMARAFPALTANMQALGQRGTPAVADLVAALETVRPAAGSADQAANNLDNLLGKINAKETVDKFKKFGVDLPAALKKAYREGKTPLEAIAELTNKTLDGDLSRLTYLFGDKQAGDALRPLIQNLERYRQLRDEVANSEGAIDRAFARRLDDAQAKADQLAAKWDALKNRWGEGMRPLTDGWNKFLDRTLDEGLAMAGDKDAAARHQARMRQIMASNEADWQNHRKRMVAVFGSLRGNLTAAGTEAMLGLINGMQGRYDLVQERMRRMADGLSQAWRSFWKIRSPSRVMMEMGGYLTQGLAIGLDRGADAPATSMRRAAGRVMAAGADGLAKGSREIRRIPTGPEVRRTAAAAPGPSVVDNRSYTVNVHAQPGQDPRAIADQVMERIDQADRAERLSRMRDDD